MERLWNNVVVTLRNVHQVTVIEDYSRGVDVHYEFISWELHGTFLILIIAGLNLP
jgi:hypothetical protein